MPYSLQEKILLSLSLLVIGLSVAAMVSLAVASFFAFYAFVIAAIVLGFYLAYMVSKAGVQPTARKRVPKQRGK